MYSTSQGIRTPVIGEVECLGRGRHVSVSNIPIGVMGILAGVVRLSLLSTTDVQYGSDRVLNHPVSPLVAIDLTWFQARHTLVLRPRQVVGWYLNKI